MNTRLFNLNKDKEGLDKLWRKHHQNDFGIPPYSQVLAAVAAEEDGFTIAYGFTIIQPEFLIVVDKDGSQELRGEAIKQMTNHGLHLISKLGYDGAYCKVHDKAFENFLKNRCGFVDAQGKLLYKGTEHV